jgi:voltage-gated potassium channel
LGVGVALYTIGSAFEALMEGRLSEQIARSRRQHVLDQLHGHVVVCGWGQVGVAISAALRAAATDVVVIDRREDLDDLVDGFFVMGDATEDAVLVAAGIGRARGLVIALDSDADCMYVTLTARLMNPDLFIVARANAAEAVHKLLQAGADRAVSPHEIGGNRMAAFMMQPNIADFLGETMHDGRLQVQLHEFEVSNDTELDGATLADSGIQEASGVVFLAVRQKDGSFMHLPRPETKLRAGDVPIVMGTAEQLDELRVFLNSA